MPSPIRIVRITARFDGCIVLTNIVQPLAWAKTVPTAVSQNFLVAFLGFKSVRRSQSIEAEVMDTISIPLSTMLSGIKIVANAMVQPRPSSQRDE